MADISPKYGNPVTTGSGADAASDVAFMGKQKDLYVSEIHGRYYTPNYRGGLFAAFANGVTVPVIASALVSVFTLYNPPGSGVNMEVVRTRYGQIVTATVIDALAWWNSTAALSALGTFTTPGTVRSKIAGNNPANKGLFYSAYTHSGTPTIEELVGAWGSTSANEAGALVDVIHDGGLIIPPGVAMSLAMTTGAGTAAAAVIQADWLEWPV